jgi:hypothetical protein
VDANYFRRAGGERAAEIEHGDLMAVMCFLPGVFFSRRNRCCKEYDQAEASSKGGCPGCDVRHISHDVRANIDQ